MPREVTPQGVLDEIARRHLLDFTKRLWPEFKATKFHTAYYNVLHQFAIGNIKKLIITIPPQHGKSVGSSKYLPAYMLGRNPDLNIALMSYSTTFARKFNRHLQRVIDTDEYRGVFNKTQLNNTNIVMLNRGYLRNADEFEIVDRLGSFKTLGREGSLTGNTVDVLIFDDLYKDAMEANSPIIRSNVIDMYKSVAETRLHNESQELCVFTRWHENDLIGWFEQNYKVININSIEQIEQVTDWSETWVKVNFESIKETEPTELDDREIGEALFPEKHSIKRLRAKQKNDPIVFGCMYQGDPQPKEGLLYSEFKTYTIIPDVRKKSNYTDTADQGDDFLCSVCYDVGLDNYIYITDIVLTQDAMEKTEIMVPMMFARNNTKQANIESNNGGRGFARVVQSISVNTKVDWFHQSQNKEARILTNAGQVNEKIIMPVDWKQRWPIFAQQIQSYKRLFRANKYHDAADTITGIIEIEFKPMIKNFVL